MGDAAANKAALQTAFAALATGDGAALVALMADDFAWEIAGGSSWSGRWEGKDAVRRDLFAPLFAQFADTYTNPALRFVAEDDIVVVECRGAVATRAGERYDNSYCYVCRFEGGKLRELTEYMDTALASACSTRRRSGRRRHRGDIGRLRLRRSQQRLSWQPRC